MSKVSNKKTLSNPNYMSIDGRKRGVYDIAVSSGATRNLIESSGWFLKDHLEDITYINSTNKKRIQSTRQQFMDWQKVWKNPLKSPYNLVITSNPNDTKAQMVAMRLFLRSYTLKTNSLKIVWHQVYGGISIDKYRDEARDPNIGLMVLSNIPDFATNYKLEKVRDIVAKYNSIPKIIITTGQLPTDLGRRLRISVNYGLNIGRIKKKLSSNHQGTRF